jgi:hypothetical protein
MDRDRTDTSSLEKRPWEPPQLNELGALASVTASGASTLADGFGGFLCCSSDSIA